MSYSQSNTQSPAVLRKSGGTERVGRGLLTLEQKISNMPGLKCGAYVIFDDVNATVRNDLVPLGDSVGKSYGMAPYVFGMASS